MPEFLEGAVAEHVGLTSAVGGSRWIVHHDLIPFATTAVLTGTITPSVLESQIVGGGRTILITLTSDTWVVAGFNGQRQAIINGITSDGVEATGWNTEVRDNMAVTDVVRTSDTVVTVTLQAEAAYDITTPETITVTIPQAALDQSTSAVVASNTFDINLAATAAITGTAEPTSTETQIRTGGRTTIITLISDTWAASGAAFDAERQGIIDGCTSAQSELTGWNAEVRDNEVVGSVVRTSDTEVTITWSAAAAYDVTATETITVTIPDTAMVLTGAPLVATPTFTVTPVTVTAALSGTASPDASEAQIVNGGETLIITLTNDTWAASGAAFDAERQGIIDGCTSAQSELTGWNNEVRDNEVVGSVVRTSDTQVTITWSAAAAYDITAAETITVTVPATALADSLTAVVASTTFDVTVVSAEATGTVVPSATEAEIVTGGETLIITLTNDTWVAAGATFNAERQGIIDGCTSAQVEATGWNTEVRDNEVVGAVVRTSDTQVTITWTAAAAYDITATETITVTIPASALTDSSVDLVVTSTFDVVEAVEAGITATTSITHHTSIT